MRPGAVSWILLGLLPFLAAGRAEAIIGTIDDVPAATLLLPYFEVDLGSPNGRTTLFSINNASATAVIAHVVVWSDLSVPVLDFNLYLTGYDVQSINLADLLVRGLLPQTASAGQDPADTVSPKGAYSQDIDFASCTGQLPIGALPPTFLSHLQTSLTGRFSSLLGGCAGLEYGDNVARGYVTVDTVNNCTLRFPGDLGYFVAGGTGDASNQNVLWGDYFDVDPAGGYAEGETLVHVEADASNPETSVVGQYTFYGRYVNWTAADNREPLVSKFVAPYSQSGALGMGTDLIVWRDSKVKQGAFKCGTVPAWYPLGQEEILIFDDHEGRVVPQSFPVSPQPPGAQLLAFPGEAQRVQVGGDGFDVPFASGWLFLNFNTAVAVAGSVPPEDPLNAQSWLSVVVRRRLADRLDPRAGVGGKGRGRFDGVQIECACKPH